MLDDFMVRGALAGIAIALAAGPLGCFVIWRRMAYFGDATAHAAILGVALALILDIHVTLGIFVAATAMGLAVASAPGLRLAQDTLLGVAAHAGLALGIIAIALTGQRNVDLDAYLFGEILAVDMLDLLVIWSGVGLTLAVVLWRWGPMLAATISADMAAAAGVDIRRERLILTVALAVLVAVAIKVVGALLITAMLIIPAAAARPFARSPEAMAVWATVIGAVSTLGGLHAADTFDLPAGPAIVATAITCFAASVTLSKSA